MFPVSLDCLFLIAPSNVYLYVRHASGTTLGGYHTLQGDNSLKSV